MNNIKKIDGKNAVIFIDNKDISVIYKNVFGELSTKESRKFNFTYDDVEDIEFKKPGITMNGFILIVLKDESMHKIVINKLNEYSFEVTDEFVKDLRYMIDEREGKHIIDETRINPTFYEAPIAIIPPRKKKEDEEKKEKDDKNKPKENKIEVTNNVINIIDKPVKVVRPKTKELIDKDKIREELRIRIEEKRKETEKQDEEKQDNENIPIVKKNELKKNIEETKENEKQKIEEVAVATKDKEKEHEEKKKKEEFGLTNVLKKMNIVIKKDKTKSQEFSKEEERKITVGTVETNQKGELKKVPIEASIRPLRKEEIEELEKKKNDIIIDELKYKLYLIESELATLMYQQKILEKYVDTTYDKKQIEQLLKQIEDLIKILEAIKKEIINKMEGKDYVANKALDVTGDDIVNIDDFKTIYVKTIDKIAEFEASLQEVKERTIEKVDEINLTEKDYDNDLKELKEKQDLVKEYDDFIKRTLTYSYRLNNYVGKTYEQRTNSYLQNIYQLRTDTKILMSLSAISMVTPGRKGPANAILLTAAGITAMRDAIIPSNTVERRQVRIVPVDYSTEINRNLRDINEANKYLTDAKKDIYEIKKELYEKYRNYPDYGSIIEQFDKLEVELDRQEKELYEALHLTKNQLRENSNQKILVLENDNV